MPIPLLAAGLLAGGAGAIGAFLGWKSRDEEVNALRKEIQFLRSEVVRLQGLVKEQQSQIEVLKNKYAAVHKLLFLQRKSLSDQMKMLVVRGLFEREKCKLHLKDPKSLTFEEKEFIRIADKEDRNDEDREFCLNYIYSKYKNEISNNAYPKSDLESYISQYESVSGQCSNRLNEING